MARKITTQIFINKAKLIHNEKYDYSLCLYEKHNQKVKIICLKHDIFEQTPNNHISNKQGCPKCKGEYSSINRAMSQQEFIDRGNKIHNYKYNYAKINYVNALTKVIIICPKHGEFLIKPSVHMKSGCQKCGYENAKIKNSSNTNCFIEKAHKIHDNKYDYSDVNYINSLTKIVIKCSIHGNFNQTPNTHLSGNGCPKCNTIGNVCEPKITNFIRKSLPDIKIISQGKPKWLGRQSLDIYFPDYNIGIEYQGRQHFHPIKIFGGELGFDKIKKLDERKRSLCEKNNCILLYFTYKPKDISKNYPYKIYTYEDNLLEIIKKVIKSGGLY